MRNQLIFGEVTEYTIFHTLEKKIIGGDQQVSLDLVDQTLRYFIGWENQNFLQNEALFEMTKKTGWKSGIMYLWNT